MSFPAAWTGLCVSASLAWIFYAGHSRMGILWFAFLAGALFEHLCQMWAKRQLAVVQDGRSSDT